MMNRMTFYMFLRTVDVLDVSTYGRLSWRFRHQHKKVLSQEHAAGWKYVNDHVGAVEPKWILKKSQKNVAYGFSIIL